jgi:hypothetical protein
MPWGVWEGRDSPDGNIHVAPCRKDGTPVPPHSISVDCPCLPDSREGLDGVTIVVHNQIQ